MKASRQDRPFDAAALKREFPSLADPSLHYLDNAATAQMPAVVLETLHRFELQARANVHEGLHRLARAATDAYDEARARVARFLHARSPSEVVFTYGATSSINLLARCYGAHLGPGDEILLSVLEHHSNLVPWQRLAAERGVVLRFLPMTSDGRLDLAWLDSELTRRCRLVALTHCSNVTGAVTDVAAVVAAARAVGAKIMLDGAQRAPHGPLDVRKLDVDFYAFSGDQMIEQVTLETATFRAPPRRFEAGTPPIAGAIGLGAALDWMQALDWRAIRAHELRLTRRLLDGLASIAGVRVLGPLDTHDRRGVVSFAVENVSAEEVCRALDACGVALRGGYHCAQPLVHAFRVEGAARASLAPYSVDEDVDALLAGLARLVADRSRRELFAPSPQP